MTVVAAFDLDGTITARDCVVPFLRRVAGERRLVTTTASGVARSPSSITSRDRLKAIAARSLAGADLDVVQAIGQRFADEVVSDWVRRDTLDQLDQHRTAGHRIVIVSASFAIYAEAIGERLGVDAVLATELAHVDGVLTGGLNGPNCRGAAKVDRLEGWFAGVGLERAGVRLHAYGDSSGDRELLAHADVAMLVPPFRRGRRASPG